MADFLLLTAARVDSDSEMEMARQLLTETPMNAGYGLFWRRVGAGMIDLTLSVLGPFFGFGLLTSVLPDRALGVWMPAIVVMLVFAISVLGRLWMLVDREHRTLFDHLFGVVVVPALDPPGDRP